MRLNRRYMLKEQLGDAAELTVLSIGPDRVVEAIKKALAMGCDRGVHVQDAVAYQKDPWQIASIIASYAQSRPFDLVFTGMQSQDRGSGTGWPDGGRAAGLSCATTLVDFSCVDGTITAKRELEGGIKGVVRMHVPALVTCQLGLNIPRYPTLPNIMKAKKKEIVSVPVDELLSEAPFAATAGFYPPVKSSGGLVLEGDLADMADKLIGILKEKTTVLK